MKNCKLARNFIKLSMDNIKLSEVKRLLLEGLQPLADKHGYKVVKSRFSLEQNKEKINSIELLENHFNYIQLTPIISVTVKEIRDIWLKFHSSLDSNSFNTYWSSLIKLEYWFEDIVWNDFKGDNHYLPIYTYDDIPHVITKIEYLYNNYAIRYINEFSNVEGVNILMNSTPEIEYSSEYHPKDSAWWHCPGFHVQSVVGLIAAKLTDNGSSYKYISEVYTSRIKKYKAEDNISENHINRFFTIKDYLN